MGGKDCGGGEIASRRRSLRRWRDRTSEAEIEGIDDLGQKDSSRGSRGAVL